MGIVAGRHLGEGRLTLAPGSSRGILIIATELLI